MSGQIIIKADKLNNFSENPMFESRDWIYNAVKLLKPKRVLELGTESGCSYFAVAQAIVDNDIDSELTAVDCWCAIEGYPFHPKHFETFTKILGAYNDKRLKYKEGFFKDILPSDNSKYDIIIYDGSHIAGKTEEDFQMFFKNIADNGIVLIHDIHSPKCDENKWWWDKGIEYYNWSLGGRFGLGILAPKGRLFMDKLKQAGLIRHIRKNKICE